MDLIEKQIRWFQYTDVLVTRWYFRNTNLALLERRIYAENRTEPETVVWSILKIRPR